MGLFSKKIEKKTSYSPELKLKTETFYKVIGKRYKELCLIVYGNDMSKINLEVIKEFKEMKELFEWAEQQFFFDNYLEVGWWKLDNL